MESRRIIGSERFVPYESMLYDLAASTPAGNQVRRERGLFGEKERFQVAKDKENKTNVMRILDKEKVPYKFYFYDHEDGAIDGVAVARKLNQNVEQVFKTLVTKGASGAFYVFVVPVAKELHLKSAAKSVGEKSVEMIHVNEINRATGYIRGGCSPIGMKKLYRTVVDKSCEAFPTIIVSGGKIGAQVEVAPQDLLRLVQGTVAEIAVEP